MEECFWELFRATGAPVFYLLYLRESEREAKTAWCAQKAELV